MSKNIIEKLIPSLESFEKLPDKYKKDCSTRFYTTDHKAKV